jgi:hypothetical protein
VIPSRLRKREALERHRDGLLVAPVSDDRGAIADPDEPGASVVMNHGLVRLKVTCPTKAQLQKFRPCNRVQGGGGIHAASFGSALDRPPRSVA